MDAKPSYFESAISEVLSDGLTNTFDEAVAVSVPNVGIAAEMLRMRALERETLERRKQGGVPDITSIMNMPV